MPRSRNIKPAFFSNDELAEIPPIGRLLFIGLWTIADYKGDLSYRPARIKAQLLPYDNCDIEQIIKALDLSGFISIYSVQDQNYIHITNFCKHQNPHINEKRKGSDIPEFKQEYTQVVDSKEVAINLDSNGTDPADSCFLIPDILIPESICPEPCQAQDLMIIGLPTNKFNTQQEQYSVTESQLAEWSETYPAVDVDQTLKRIRSWLVNNPSKRKTMRGMGKFIDSWLSREQDRGKQHETHNRSNTKQESNHARQLRELGDAIFGPD